MSENLRSGFVVLNALAARDLIFSHSDVREDRGFFRQRLRRLCVIG